MEIWKDVVGYEGLYLVSNYGKVKRLNGCARGVNLKYTDNHILTLVNNGKGYLRVKLSKDGKSRRVMLHRIIAEAFIENLENKRVINHKNGIKADNRIENLEWITQSENCKHAYKTGLRIISEKEMQQSLINLKKRWK